MLKIRYGLFVLLILMCAASSVSAQVSIGFSTPQVSIGINLPVFPELVPVPGYPVYYAPRAPANYFFYDGMYWVFLNDYWYASYWYNGPWWIVDPDFLPVFILRIPVRYYVRPPVYFRSWHLHAPPRWGERWGHSWEQRRPGWDRWKRDSVPARAPLPGYQRSYTGDRYPSSVEQQRTLRNRNYRYQPRDRVVRQHFQQPAVQRAPAPVQRQREERAPIRSTRPEVQRPAPFPQGAPAGRRAEPSRRGDERMQQRGPDRQPPGAVRQEQPAPRMQGPDRSRDRRESQQPGRGQGQGQHRGEGRGGGRDK